MPQPPRHHTEPSQPPARADAPTGPDGLLALEGVTVRHGATVAVDDVSLEVGRGEIVALLGANGAGKSSTLNAIAGLLPVARGRILLDGVDIAPLPPERTVERGVSLTPEGRQVFGRLTVEENLRVGAASAGPARYAELRAEAFELFPLLERKRDTFAGLLSGGEQQQLAIARSLMSSPRLLLLDEPSLGLAPQIIERVFELIALLRERGTTLMLAEQNVDKALAIADRAYVLTTGRVDLSGTASELLDNPDVEAAYLGLGVPDER